MLPLFSKIFQMQPRLVELIGSDKKGWLSLVLYVLGIVLAFVHAWLDFAGYVGVALIWLIPDRRIENRIGHE
jgi:uncharacterized membrane protein